MYRILLIESDLVAGEITARDIELCGHLVERAPSLRAGAAIAAERAFDAAVCVDSGPELREFSAAYPAIPLIAIGAAPRGVVVAASLVRPFPRETLCGKLRLVLSGSGGMREMP